MNLKTALLFALCISASVVHAQKTELEILAGPSISIVYGNWAVVDEETRPRISVTSGIGFNYHLKEKLAIGVKGLFEQKGCVAVYDLILTTDGVSGTQEKVKARYRSSYFTVPVTLQFTRGNRIKFTGEVGLFGGLLLRQTYKQKAAGSYPASKENITSNLKPFDAGVSVGFRTSIPLSEKLNFNIVLFDNLGLLNTSKYATMRTNSLVIFSGVSYKLQ